MFLCVATCLQRSNFLASATIKVALRGPNSKALITAVGRLTVTKSRSWYLTLIFSCCNLHKREFKTQFVHPATLTAKMNTSYLFELQQNVVHSSVSIASEQNRFAARHQYTDQAGDGGGLPCTWHAEDQCIVMSTQCFGHRLPLPRVQLL